MAGLLWLSLGEEYLLYIYVYVYNDDDDDTIQKSHLGERPLRGGDIGCLVGKLTWVSERWMNMI